MTFVYDWLYDHLLFVGPAGMIALAVGLRQLRLWIVSLRKKPKPPEQQPLPPAQG